MFSSKLPDDMPLHRFTQTYAHLSLTLTFSMAFLPLALRRIHQRTGNGKKNFKYKNEQVKIMAEPSPPFTEHIALQALRKCRRLHYSPLGQSPLLCFPPFSNLELKWYLEAPERPCKSQCQLRRAWQVYFLPSGLLLIYGLLLGSR